MRYLPESDFTTTRELAIAFNELLRTFAPSGDPQVKITAEGGVAVKMIGGPATPLVKGEVVRSATTSTRVVNRIVVDVPDPFGVVYDDSIAQNEEGWIVIAGLAQVYFIGSTSMRQLARGFVTGDAGYVAGQALSEAFPAAPFSTDKHFYEIGHVVEARTGAGLALTVLHFN